MINQFDKVLHPKYGEGYVLNIQYRKDSNLFMIYYYEGTYDWMLEEELSKYIQGEEKSLEE